MASQMELNVAEDASSGPVMLMMNKRLRALKKKLNRIAQIEEAKQLGKSINKEQEEVLRSKTQVTTLIEEYERLRQPLMAAVKEEVGEKLKEAMAAKEQELHPSSNGSPEAEVEAATPPPEEVELEDDKPQEPTPAATVELQDQEQHLSDILHLLYFSQLFDVKPVGTWTKYHERTSCLSYDLVTDDDSVSHLHESDLDALAAFGSLMTSRPPNTTLSHKEALQTCVAHARSWLLNAEEPIENGFNITYAELRERLNRILGTEYYTMTPELQTVTKQIVESAAEHYSGFEVAQEQYGNGADSVSNSAGNISDSSGNNADVSQDSTQVTSNDNYEAQPEEALEEKPQVFEKQPQAENNNNNNNNNINNGDGGQFQFQQQRYRGPRGGYSRGRGYGPRGRGRGTAQNGRQGQYYEQSGYYQQKSYYSGGGNNSNNNRRGRGGGGYYNNNSNSNSNSNVNNISNNNNGASANGPVVSG